MKNAAMVLGVIGGVVGMVVGFFAYGWIEVSGWFSEVSNGLTDEALGEVGNAERAWLVSLFAPILGIAGGAMSTGRPLIGAVAMFVSAYGMYWGFGFNVFTMFPIAMCLIGGLLGASGAIGRGQ